MDTTRRLWLRLAALLIASFSVLLWIQADLRPLIRKNTFNGARDEVIISEQRAQAITQVRAIAAEARTT